MSFKRLSGGALAALAIGVLPCACSGKADDCAANKNCGPYDGGASGVSNAGNGASGHGGRSGAGGASGGSGEAGAAGADSGCSPTADPASEPCVIKNDYAVFVATTGSDEDDGSADKPFATLGHALSAIGDGVRRIYLCAGRYEESVTLAIPTGVEIYGGFSCAGLVWRYDSPTKAYVVSAQPIAATITNGVGVVLQDLRLDAGDAVGERASSIGLLVSASRSVLLNRVDIRAGKGSAGATGKHGDDGLIGTASSALQNGKQAVCGAAVPGNQVGPSSLDAICGSQGGVGGTASKSTVYSSAQVGSDGTPGSGADGGPGGMTFGVAATSGKDGGRGMDGDVGVAAAAVGSFDAGGYVAASGRDGTSGQPGTGGGGGGASLGSLNCLGATGGAGGMGGCGAAFGAAGGGGGASVSVLSLKSGLTVRASRLTAISGGAGGDGGNGGIGGGGRDGGSGGATDTNNTVGAGGRGGKGGNGGNGGSGSGGSGGPSLALAYSMPPSPAKVDVDDSNELVSAAVPSAAGKGGIRTVQAPSGQPGVTATMFEID